MRIRSHEEFTCINLKLESTWGTDPGTWGTASYRMPFRSEDLHYETDVFPDSEEFGTLGGLLSVDLGRRLVQGSIVVEPAYNTLWFWTLFSQAWGAENLVVDDDIWATGSQTGLNTHIFSPGTGLAEGLSLRIYKSGQDDGGYYDLITGLIVTRMVWEQPRGDRARVTFDFIGKTITTNLASGITPTALETGIVKFKARDLERTGSVIKTGVSMADLNIMGFTLEIDRQIGAGDNFLNDLDTLDKPGIEGTRAVTITIDTDLEQDYGATGKPWTEFLSQATSSVVIAYEADTDAITSKPYAMRIDLPAVTFVDARPNIRQAGTQPWNVVGRAVVGDIDNFSDAGLNDHNTIPTGGSTDVRVLCHVAEGDEPATDSKFSSLPNG